jgi:hypothetical protein
MIIRAIRATLIDTDQLISGILRCMLNLTLAAEMTTAKAIIGVKHWWRKVATLLLWSRFEN